MFKSSVVSGRLMILCFLLVRVGFSQPSVTSFTPEKGAVGTNVVISGSNFNAVAAKNTVFFGAVSANVVNSSANSITVVVPGGASYKPISVLNEATGLTGYSAKPFNVTFSNPLSGISSNFYGPKVDFNTSNLPFSVVLGDLNTDGKPDMVVINQFSASIGVFKNTDNNGNGVGGNINSSSFAPRLEYSTAENPWFAEICDVDGDGRPEIIVANNGLPSSVSVFHNTGNGNNISFSDKVDFLTGYGPTSVAVADLDNDGKPELVTSNRGGSISILKNKCTPGTINSGSFAAKVDIAASASSRFIAVGDIDADGKRDLIVTNELTNKVSVFHNISTPGRLTTSSFAAKVDFTVGTNPVLAALSDIDGDNKPDIIVANAGSNNISILRNTSSQGVISGSSFAGKVDFVSSARPYTIAIADVDGDGKPDIISSNTGVNSNYLSVFKNISTSGVINNSSLANRVDFNVGSNPYSLTTGDIDRDGIPEQVLISYNSNKVSILQKSW